MSEQASTEWRAFLEDRGVLFPECWKAIVRQALETRPHAPAALRQLLDTAVQTHVEIRGFRPGRIPYLSLPIFNDIVQVSRDSGRLHDAILLLWLHANPSALHAAHRFIEQYFGSIEQAIECADNDPSTWFSDDFVQATEAFAREQEQIPEQDLLLPLFCFATGLLRPRRTENESSDETEEPLNAGTEPEAHPEATVSSQRAETQEERITVSTTTSDPTEEPAGPGLHQSAETHDSPRPLVPLEMHALWTDWLGLLQALPPEAPEWTSLPAFIEEVQRVAAEKAGERETGQHALQQAFDALAGYEAYLMDYFDLAPLEGLVAEAYPMAVSGELTTYIEQFCTKIQEHQERRAEPRAARLADAQAQRRALETVEVEILAAHAELAKALQVSLTEPPPSELESVSSTGGGADPQQPSADDAVSIPASPVADSPPAESEGQGAEHLPPLAADPANGDGGELGDLAPAGRPSSAIRDDAALESGAPVVEQPAQIDDDAASAAAGDLAGGSAALEDAPASQSPEESLFEARFTDDEAETILDVEEEETAAEDLETPEDPLQELEEDARAPVPRSTTDEMVEATIEENEYTSLLWTLIDEDDLPGAYWLSISLAAQGLTPPVPDWILAAVQGARWVRADSDHFVNDLLEISQNHQPKPNLELFGLAAALMPALVAPASGMVGWLNAPSTIPSLHSLVTAISEFAAYSLAIHPDELAGVTNIEQRRQAPGLLARQATRWLEEAQGRRTTYPRATEVWRNLVKPRGLLREFLLPVMEDRHTDVDTVREELGKWRRKEYAQEQIQRIDQELRARKDRPIVGPVLQRLLRNVEEACDLAEEWVKRVDQARAIETRGGTWFFEKVTRLRLEIQAALPDVLSALHELCSPAQPLHRRGAARCLLIAVQQLGESLHLAPAETEPWSRDERELLFLSEEVLIPGSLRAALSRRLLWLPELTLDDDGEPSPAALAALPQVLLSSHQEGRLLERRSRRQTSEVSEDFGSLQSRAPGGSLTDVLAIALEGWLEQEDYRFADLLLGALHGDSEGVGLPHGYEERLSVSQATLADNIRLTERAIEQALVDGIITEEQHAEYRAQVTAINVDEVRHFRPKNTTLRQIREQLEAAREERRTQLQAKWDELQQRLVRSHLEPGRQKKAVQFINEILSGQDTRVIEESLAHIAEALDVGGDLDESWFTPPAVQDTLAEFRRLERRLEEKLVGAERHGGLHTIVQELEKEPRSSDLFARLPTPRRKEAADAFRAWRQIKQQRGRGRGVLNPALIATVLSYLGFNLDGRKDPVEIIKNGADWLFARASMSAGDLARPVPQFGSQAQENYPVICLWDRPGAETVAALLRDLRLNMRNVLVLYLGRLTWRQRREAAYTVRNEDMSLMVIDEILLMFLALEPDAGKRLPKLLRCALPFASVNPYTPFQAGDVPPEMFFGREKMAREIQSLEGSCLVYGGRQLGKSALLRHVQRQFHDPESEHYAWVEDMKLVFDPPAGKGTENVWRVLRDGFKRHTLLTGRITSDHPDTIRQHLLDALRHHPTRRVLVMFDEADNFLDADARDNFRVVTALRNLMTETGRRFKVVFAGLHNVQRFDRIPNQPLAHFGAPLAVGPLEPEAAQQLVREPLEALGYRFVSKASRYDQESVPDPSVVLQVLSYTNYHPGLIQLFCRDLLQSLQQRTSNTMPPYDISQADVEDVYRTQYVRDRIRERFDWTLALDPRYQAIAWVMIEDQIKTRDSYARPYPPGDVMEMVHEWWPQGFEDVGLDQLRGLLEEMCGLGVLVRHSPSGHYRLRSPNLVRLMGTEDVIVNNLLELGEKPAPMQPSADLYHAPLDDSHQRYSPLTYAQERNLNLTRAGVCLICASPALGLESLPTSTRRLASLDIDGPPHNWIELPAWLSRGDDLERRLEEIVRVSRTDQRLAIYYGPVDADGQELKELVQTAIDFCRRPRVRKRQIRILFVFDPVATWNWMALPYEFRQRMEERADAVLFPRRWNREEVRRRLLLAKPEKIATDQVCDHVLRGTGGWPFLLDVLFERLRKKDDPRADAEKLALQLGDVTSQVHREFREALGIKERSDAWRLLMFVAQEPEKQLPVDLIDPELIGGTPRLTLESCQRALEYLERLGCVERDGDDIKLAPIVAEVMVRP